MTSRLLPFLALVAAVGIFFAYVNPLWNGAIAQAKAAIAEDDRALASAAQYVKRQNELAAQASAIDPVALARLETYLPDSVDNVGLVLDLHALADRSGLSLESVDVAGGSSGASASLAAGTAAADPVGTIDLTLAATGTYEDLNTFLAGVELSARLLDMRELSVAGSDTGVYDYTMTLRLYWLR
ncbi:MAG TPA: hypothetical protein VJK73_00525 [Candidatus Paceibacterota bacterium]